MNRSIFLSLSVLGSVLVLCVTLRVATAWSFGWFDKYEDVTTDADVVVIPAATLQQSKVHYYVFKHQGRDIRFFLLKDTQGIVRAAFDACDVCYKSKKGYSPDGDYVICNNCGQAFHVSRINLVKGGCNPEPLNRDYDHQEVRITVRDILAGARLF